MAEISNYPTRCGTISIEHFQENQRFHARQSGLQVHRQGAGQLVAGNANWLVDSGQRVLRQNIVFGLAKGVNAWLEKMGWAIASRVPGMNAWAEEKEANPKCVQKVGSNGVTYFSLSPGIHAWVREHSIPPVSQPL